MSRNDTNCNYIRIFYLTHFSAFSTGPFLCMRPANERRRYNVTLTLIGWAHTRNVPWQWHIYFPMQMQHLYIGLLLGDDNPTECRLWTEKFSSHVIFCRERLCYKYGLPKTFSKNFVINFVIYVNLMIILGHKKPSSKSKYQSVLITATFFC